MEVEHRHGRKGLFFLKKKEKGRRAAASEEAVACASGLLAHALVLGAQTNCFEEFIFIFLFYKFLKIYVKPKNLQISTSTAK